jgi:vesicle coat complex subunit
MSSQNTLFCNYFLANKKFWLHWLTLADYLVAISEEQVSDLSSQLNAPTSYGEQQLPMKVFVQERLASICLLAYPDFKCLNYSPFNIGPSTTPFNQFFNEAVLSDALKRAYVQTSHISYLNAFASLRDSVIKQLQNS